MARQLRLEYEGAIYHITSRGNERSDIFSDVADIERFLEKLAEGIARHHIRLYAYVIMTNHYHLLVETPRANLSAFMQQLNTSYTMYYNVRHQRVGHLFSGRYKAKLVQGDRYLLGLTRYIHLNMVKMLGTRALPIEERVRRLREYSWSSYPAYAGLRRIPSWLDTGPLRELVGWGHGERREAYRRFVESGMAEDDEDLKIVLARSSKAVGDSGFCRWVEREFQELRKSVGRDVDVTMRRIEVGVEPSRVIREVCQVCKVAEDMLKRRRSLAPARLLALLLLREHTGMNQREVGIFLGLRDGSGLGRMIKEATQRLDSDQRFRKLYRKVEESLSC